MRTLLICLLLLPLQLHAEVTETAADMEEKKKEHSRLVSQALETANKQRHGREEAADKSVDHVQSEAYQARLSEMNQHLVNVYGLSKNADKTKDDTQDNQIHDTQLILFVSSSIPFHVLQRYARSLHAVHGTMILRGPIGGMSQLKPTIAFINSLTKVNPECVDEAENPCERLKFEIRIDPKRFLVNDVAQVPALIAEPRGPSGPYCDTGEPTKSAHIAYGDASLAGLTQTLYELSDDEKLKPLLSTLN